MTRNERARTMRREGVSFAEIAKDAGVHLATAYRIAGEITRGKPVESARTIVRDFPHNGGCSTYSEPRPVSLPRILALHGAYAA